MADIIATERIYDPEQLKQGIFVVLFHEGDRIPEATATKLGIKFDTKKVSVSKVENKAVKADTKTVDAE